MVTETVFILVFSVTSGAGAIDAQLDQHFATKKECLVDRERLLEAHRQSFPKGLGEMTNARCEQVKRAG
jgi:hypothetical protein